MCFLGGGDGEWAASVRVSFLSSSSVGGVSQMTQQCDNLGHFGWQLSPIPCGPRLIPGPISTIVNRKEHILENCEAKWNIPRGKLHKKIDGKHIEIDVQENRES